MLTKGAIGNLVNRYKAVLKKCNLINTFGSLAVASMLVMGGAGVAGASVESTENSLVVTSENPYSHNTAIKFNKTTWEGEDRGVLKVFYSSATFSESVEVKADVTPATNSEMSVSGIRINESVVSFDKDVTAWVKNSREEDNSDEDGDQRQAAGISVTNDLAPHPDNITTFAGNVESYAESLNGEAYAMLSSAGRVKAYMKGASVALTANSSNSNSYALCVFDTGEVATSANTAATLTATANNGTAYGIEAAGGKISFDGSTSIAATGKTAYGIYAYDYSGESAQVALSNANISATASSGPAYAVYNQSSAASSIGAEDNSSVVTLTATNTGTGTARGIYNDGGTLTVNGDVEIKTQTASGLSLGIDNRGGGTLTVNGSSLNIEVKSTLDRAYGIQTSGSSNTFINSGNVTINSYAEDEWQAAVRTNSDSSITFANNVTANLFYGKLSEDLDSSNNTNGLVAGIHVNEGTATFQKGLTISITDKSTATGTEIGALWVVGENQNSLPEKNKISVAGHTDLTVSTASRSGMGILSGCKSLVELASATITVTSSDGSSYGIRSQGNSTVDISGNAVITATGKKDAYGIFTGTEHGGGKFSLTGNTNTITATSTGEGKAYAVYMNEGGTGVIGNASSTSTFNGDVYVADGASLTLHGTVNLNGVLTNNATDNAATTDVTEGVSGNATVVFGENASVTEGSKAVADTLKAEASGELNDKLGGDLEAFKESYAAGFNEDNVTMAEGLVQGAVDASGKQAVSTTMSTSLELATSAPLAVNRILMNDIRKRMGDLRTNPSEYGAWARYEGGKLKGDGGLTNNFSTIQVGADKAIGDSFRLGAAFSYTYSDVEHATGDAEADTFMFSGYGIWMGQNGMFADVIARVGTTDTDMTVKGLETSIDTMTYSLSGEFGWRFDLCKSFYVEPQVELTYTYVDGDKFSLGSAKFDVDEMNSLIGRAGVLAGWKFSDRGDVYARASVLQEFAGDTEITGVNGKGSTYKQDGDDTWFEYGIGANVKLTDNAYIWADVERTEGAEIEEEWRGTVGVRFSF